MTTAVIFGGKSTEHDISCASACNVLENISGCEVIKIGITKNGSWLLTEASPREIKALEWDKKPDNAEISVNLTSGCFESNGKKLRIDAVFPVLHGKNGEDGTVQGLLECLGLPYVGCGVLASALCMDKAFANRIFAQKGIAHTPWIAFSEEEYLNEPDKIIGRIKKELSFPVFIKPSRAGSSVGISECKSADGIVSAVKEALKVDTEIIVEQGVRNAKELEVAVIGEGATAKASAVGRVMSAEEFYTYSSKYSNAASYNMIPADIPEDISDKIRAAAVEAFRACGCRGLSRVDFFLTESCEIMINEINTMPGFTSISMYPQLFIKGGMSYGSLLKELLKSARRDS